MGCINPMKTKLITSNQISSPLSQANRLLPSEIIKVYFLVNVLTTNYNTLIRLSKLLISISNTG